MLNTIGIDLVAMNVNDLIAGGATPLLFMDYIALDKMDKSVLPCIKVNVVSDFYLTPDYFEKELSTLHGSGFSIQPKFTQSAYFRFHNQSETFKNLYFVGAGTHPGAGIPGVLSSAKILDELF